MTKLAAQPLLDTHAIVARPEHGRAPVALDDAALSVMTDLRRQRAITINRNETLGLAERLMASAGVRLLLVLEDGNRLAGLVTYRDLHGPRATAAAARDKVSHDALTVAQVMTPAAQIETVPLRSVEHAHVRDVVELLREHGRQHTLVTETVEGGVMAVRGIFSITQIGRQLGVKINASERVQSFAEIEQLIAAG